MDWSNESYVRLYVRDTTNWRRIGWDGQCVLMQLLRKLDRAGTMELAGLEPWEAVMLHINGPEDVCKRGVAELLRVETMVILGDRLVFPSFIEAQECTKSDRLRAKESRDRRARPESQPVTAPSQNVTGESQDVTKPSQVVTSGHEPSRAVTPRHSLLCSALPYSALPSLPVLSDARARPEPVDRLPEPEPDTGQEFTDRRMQAAFWAEYEAVQRVPPNMAGKNLDGFHAVVCRTASLQGQDPRELFVDKVRVWLSNPLGKVERQAPYACFRQAWGDLTAVGDAKGGTGEPETVESLRKVGMAALLRGDQVEVAKIGKRITALENKADSQVRRAR